MLRDRVRVEWLGKREDREIRHGMNGVRDAKEQRNRVGAREG